MSQRLSRAPDKPRFSLLSVLLLLWASAGLALPPPALEQTLRPPGAGSSDEARPSAPSLGGEPGRLVLDIRHDGLARCSFRHLGGDGLRALPATAGAGAFPHAPGRIVRTCPAFDSVALRCVGVRGFRGPPRG
jgi:hypothetical protein